MQAGSVQRHGRGWRGLYYEAGRRRVTATYERKGEARLALNRELERVALGDAWIPLITLAELADRFLPPVLGCAADCEIRARGGLCGR